MISPKNRESARLIRLHRFHTTLPLRIKAVTWQGCIPQGQHHGFIDFLDSLRVRKLPLYICHPIPVVKDALFGGSGRFNRGIPEEVHDQFCKLIDFVVRHPLSIAGIQKSAHRNHIGNPLCNGRPFQFHMGIGFCQTAVAEGQSGRGIGLVVVPAVIAAVLAMLLFQKPLPLFGIGVLAEKREGIQTGFIASLGTTQNTVYFIVGNEEPPLRVIPIGGGENMRLPLQIFKPAQKCYRVIPSISEQIAVFFIYSSEQCPLIYKLTEGISIFQKVLHLGFDFREAALGRIGQCGQGEIPGIPGFIAEFPSGINQGLSQF